MILRKWLWVLLLPAVIFGGCEEGDLFAKFTWDSSVTEMTLTGQPFQRSAGSRPILVAFLMAGQKASQQAAEDLGLGVAAGYQRGGMIMGIIQGSALLFAMFMGFILDKIDRVTGGGDRHEPARTARRRAPPDLARP